MLKKRIFVHNTYANKNGDVRKFIILFEDTPVRRIWVGKEENGILLSWM